MATVAIRFNLDDNTATPIRGIESNLRGMAGTAQGIATTALAGLATGFVAVGAAALGAGRKLVDMAGDAGETQSLLQSTLGTSADSFNGSLQALADTAGRSFFDLQQGSSTIVAMSKAMGLGEQDAADYASQWSQVAVDFGSFYNATDTEVFEDIQSALAGSSETMQKYGIDVSQATLKQAALDAGLISVGEEMDRTTRAQILQMEVMRQGADAMGDAADTADSATNQQRAFFGAIRDTATEMGAALLPSYTNLISSANELASEYLPKLTDWFSGKFIPTIQDIPARIAPFIQKIREVGNTIAGFIQNHSEAFVGAIKGIGIALGAIIAAGTLVAIVGGIAALANPITGIIVAAGLLGTAWTTNWGGIQTKTKAVIDFVQPYITNAIGTIKQLWGENSDSIKTKAVEIWQGTQDKIQAVIDFVKPYVVNAISTISQWWAENSDSIKTKAVEIWGFIQTYIGSTFDAIKLLFSSFKLLFEGDWAGFLEGLWEVAKIQFVAIVQLIASLWAGGEHFEGIHSILVNLWGNFTSWFESQDWRQLAYNITTAIIGVLQNLWAGDSESGGVKAAFTNLWTQLKSWFTSTDWGALGQLIIDGILAVLVEGNQMIIDFIMSIAQGAIDAIMDAFGGGGDSTSEAQSNVIESSSVESRLPESFGASSATSGNRQRAELQVTVDVNNPRFQESIRAAILVAVQRELGRQGQRVELIL